MSALNDFASMAAARGAGELSVFTLVLFHVETAVRRYLENEPSFIPRKVFFSEA